MANKELIVKGAMDAYRQKAYDVSAVAFKRLTELYPNEPDYWMYLGLSHEWVGELAQAEKALDQAIRHDPEESWYYFFRGHIRYTRKNYQDAIVDFDEAFKRNEAEFDYVLHELFLYRGKCFEELGQYDQAITSYTLYGSYISHLEESKPHIERAKKKQAAAK